MFSSNYVVFCFPAPISEASSSSWKATCMTWTYLHLPQLHHPSALNPKPLVDPPPPPQHLPTFHSFQHCRMAGRGGPARTNGTAASNKICQFKLVLLGESAVGKSSLVLRFVKGQFHEYQESTIGGEGALITREVSVYVVMFPNLLCVVQTEVLLWVHEWNVAVTLRTVHVFSSEEEPMQPMPPPFLLSPEAENGPVKLVL